MNRKKNIVLLVALIIVLTASIVLSKIFVLNNKIIRKEDKIDKLINISKLDKAFMKKYYNDMDELHKKSDLKNALILVSFEEPEEVYGATAVVAAPNNTYFLDYKDKFARDRAKKEFEKNDNTFNVSENREYEFLDVDTDSSNYNSWGIHKAGLDHAIDYINQNGGEDVTVAILDSGCNMDLFNASYQGKIESTYNLYNVGIYGHDVMFDDLGHGTHIAGTIAEGTSNKVKILPIKVGDKRNLDHISVIEGINYITDDHKADVINMSFGSHVSEVTEDAEYLAIEAARKENIISVAAAGNYGDLDNPLEVPSAYDNTLSISAADENLNVAGFSSHNYAVSFAAPGVDIKSINGVMSGTSMATPHAVCAVAFLKSIEKKLTFDGVVNALKQNVIDLGPPGRDDYYGEGFIDLSNFSICQEEDLTNCTTLDIEKEFIPVNVEFYEAVLTPYNYGSITNLMPSKVKLLDENGEYKITTIDSLVDAEIIDYDPYATGNQQVTIKYQGIQLSFSVTNPENYEMGWKYRNAYNQEGILTEDYKIYGYLDNNMNLRNLYVPETIYGHKVVDIGPGDPNYPNVFGNSSDANNITKLVFPSSIKELYLHLDILPSLYEFVSLADELIIGGSPFSFHKTLKTVDANLLFTENSGQAFYHATSLKEVHISPNSKIIPYQAFYNCISLKNIEIPEGIEEIGDEAFFGSWIKNINLPNTIQKVGRLAFVYTFIEEVEIPENTTYIGPGAFGTVTLRKITVSENNSVYDSRNNSNAIIETATNKLIAGSSKTKVPNEIKEIGDLAFYYSSILELELPDGLEKIGVESFADCFNLYKIVIPESTINIDETSFNQYIDGVKGKKLFFDHPLRFFHVYRSSYAYNYVLNHNLPYVLLDDPEPPKIKSIWFNGKLEYLPFETLEIDTYRTTLEYEGIDEKEIITEFRNPVYENGDSFRYGDNDALLFFDTSHGYYNLEMSIPIEVLERATPEYEIPTDIYANLNSTLEDVELPDGFEWEDTSIVLNELGDLVYYARYIPEDTENYKTVEHILIPVHVINKSLIKPRITIQDKSYDGNILLPEDDITIEDIDENDYTIKSVILTSPNAGSQIVFVELKLTDEKYENYSFANGKQSKVFECSINILPIVVKIPRLMTREYVYNGEYQHVDIINIDEEYMDVEGNLEERDAGYYHILISLKDKTNYIWDIGGSVNVGINFIIAPANIDFTSSDVEVIYDGKPHTIELQVNNENAVVKYMDANGEYTLDEIPKYTEVGEYIVKYQISIDDNYTTAYGEKTLSITPRSVSDKTITFCSNTGTDEIKTQTVPMDEEIKLEKNTFNREGYIFKNWNTERDGSGTSYTDEGNISIENDITLYAQWEEQSADIIINNYEVDDSNKNISNITINTTVDDFKNHIELHGDYRVEVDSKKVNNTDVLYTGGKTKIYNADTLVLEYTNVVKGDVIGDGALTILDLINTFGYLNSIDRGTDIRLNQSQLLAADYTRNGTIDIVDLIQIFGAMDDND